MNDKPAIIMNIQRQPGANIITTVDRVEQLLPQLKAALPSSVDVSILTDRTTTIRASVNDVELTLLIQEPQHLGDEKRIAIRLAHQDDRELDRWRSTTDRLDQVVYLARGGAASGTVNEVITSDTLSALYQTRVEVLHTADGRLVVVGDVQQPFDGGGHGAHAAG